MVVGFPQGHDFQTINPNLPKNVSKAGKNYIYLKASLPLFSPAEDVKWHQPQSGQLDDQYDDHEAASNSGAHAHHAGADPGLHCPHKGEGPVAASLELFGSCRLNVAPIQRCFWCLLHILLLQESNMAGK